MSRSVNRACNILELIGPRKGGLRLTDISKALNIPVSSLSSILSGLVENGYLLVHPESKRYILGPKPLILANYYLSFFDIVRSGQAIINEVMTKTEESTALMVRKDSEAMVVYGENCSQAIRRSIEIGHRTPIYASASGRAILAYQPDSEIEKYLSSVDLIPITSATITDPELLRAELIAIRSGSLAYSREEIYDGMVAVAAPVLDFQGRSVAAIVVNIPSFRFKAEKKQIVEQTLREQAQKLSGELGINLNKDQV
jgi:IclR family KDG regulon transcriptional repressor